MKLSLATIAALISALLAGTFLRFGIFCLGALVTGSVVYLLLMTFSEPLHTSTVDWLYVDHYPNNLHVQQQDMNDELSLYGWCVTVLMAVIGGWWVRWHEEATLEGLTSVLGAIGLSFSVHTTLLLHGTSCDKSWVVLATCLSTLLGWHVQRQRRLRKHYQYRYQQLKQHDVEYTEEDNQNDFVGRDPNKTRRAQDHGGWCSLACCCSTSRSSTRRAPSSNNHATTTTTLQQALQTVLHHAGTNNSNDNSSHPSTKTATDTTTASSEQISELITALQSLNHQLLQHRGPQTQAATTTNTTATSTTASSTASATDKTL